MEFPTKKYNKPFAIISVEDRIRTQIVEPLESYFYGESSYIDCRAIGSTIKCYDYLPEYREKIHDSLKGLYWKLLCEQTPYSACEEPVSLLAYTMARSRTTVRSTTLREQSSCHNSPPMQPKHYQSTHKKQNEDRNSDQ